MYSVLERTPLDTTELYLATVGDFKGVVEPTAIPAVTDEEVYYKAEQTGDWDELEALAFGVGPAEISLAALRKRFNKKCEEKQSRTVNIDTTGKFIEAIWDSKRQIPTVGEYATALGAQKFLNPHEVAMAQRISAIESRSLVQHTAHSALLAKKEEKETYESMDGDDQWLASRVRSKLVYFINLQPGVLGEDADPAKLAETYASEVAQGKKDPKHAEIARTMLLEARGLSATEIREVRGANPFSQTAERYRYLGIPVELTRHMADNPDQGFFPHPATQTNRNTVAALEGNLETQLAVRQFFGVENLHTLHQLQARVQHQYDLERARDRGRIAAFNAAIVQDDQETIERMQREADAANAEYLANGPKTIFEEPIFTSDESQQFKSLAAFLVHEPALRSNLAYFTDTSMRKQYREWLETQTATAQ